jgi:predicted nuclease of predicted toxin-antitoxin system
VIRFVLDENLPLRAAELLAAFGFPFTSTIEVADLGRGASDEAIARWCGKNRVVWVTLDRGVLKDEAIVAAIAQARTNLILLSAKGMTARDYLRLFVCRFDRIERRFEEAAQLDRALRLRQGRRGGISEISSSRFTG